MHGRKLDNASQQGIADDKISEVPTEEEMAYRTGCHKVVTDRSE